MGGHGSGGANGVDRSGVRYGRLVAVERAGRLGKEIAWSCRCDCGATKVVRGSALRSGNTTSCGCRHREQVGDRFRVHGATGTRTHRIWKGIRTRCLNPMANGFDRYGGKGIGICERWSLFANFLADMGECPPGMSIDRVDGALGYEPGNCRWATREQQSRNRSGFTRLTVDLVREIHRRCDAGQTVAAVARDMGLSDNITRMARDRRSWKDVR